MSKSYWVIPIVLVPFLGCGQPAAVPTPPKGPTASNASPPADSELGKVEQPPPIQSNGPSTRAETNSTEKQKSKPDASEPTVKKDPEDGVNALLARARAAEQSQNFAEAIRIADEVLQKEPTNQAALSLLARAAQFEGLKLVTGGQESDGIPLLFKSAQAMRRLRELNPNLGFQDKQLLGQALYNEACAYCRQKDPDGDKAVASLKDAVDAGFNDLAQIDKDTDLDPIRDREDFKEIRARAEAKK